MSLSRLSVRIPLKHFTSTVKELGTAKLGESKYKWRWLKFLWNCYKNWFGNWLWSVISAFSKSLITSYRCVHQYSSAHCCPQLYFSVALLKIVWHKKNCSMRSNNLCNNLLKDKTVKDACTITWKNNSKWIKNEKTLNNLARFPCARHLMAHYWSTAFVCNYAQ